MSLTKRLYKLDEVRSSLIFCIQTKRIQESQFWLRELEESLYGNDARRVLFIAWFLFIGLEHLTWLYEWSLHSKSKEGRERLCWQLCKLSERDGSLWWMLCAGPIVERGGTTVQQWRETCHLDGEDFWQAIVDASKDERLDSILEGLQDDMKTYTPMAKLVGHVIVRYQKWGTLSIIPPDIVHQEGNLRQQRAYKIPQGCLYGMTWRGRGGDSTEELRDLSVDTLRASPYWKRLCSSEDLEEFWNTYFEWTTVDHPDEWSLADREKSHGKPPQCVGAPLWRWWRGWIPKEHRFFWGKQKNEVWAWVQTQTIEINVLDRILELYQKMEIVPKAPKKIWVLCP
jgi:hypothetical protein